MEVVGILTENLSMASPVITDELWQVIDRLIRKGPPPPEGGGPRVGDREALTGILFVLKTGISWEDLPQEVVRGSRLTCWRRLRDWQAAGVWDRLHCVLLDDLRAVDQIDWSRAVVDSGSVWAVGGAKRLARTPPIVTRKARSTSSSRMRRAFRLPFG